MKRICIFILGIFLSLALYGQNRGVFTTAGAVVENSEFTISWTIGEPLAGDMDGFQAPIPYYALHVTNEEIQEASLLEVKIYPSVFSSFFNIRVSEEELPMELTLFSMDGKMVSKKKLMQSETRVEVPGLQASVYILKILSKNKKMYTAKLIKQ